MNNDPRIMRSGRLINYTLQNAWLARKAGSNPAQGAQDGYNGRFWYPSEREECPECQYVASPWASDPWKYRTHCGFVGHIEASMLVGDEWM